MAYDITRYGTYSARPDHRLQLYVRRSATDAANNRSAYAWQLTAQRTGAWQGSFTNGAAPWAVQVGSQFYSGSAALPFSASVSSIILGSGTTPYFTHDGNGNLNITVAADHGPLGVFGTAQVSAATFSTDRIPAAPGAPGIPVVSAIGTRGATFTWTAAARGHADINNYGLYVSTVPNFASHVYAAWLGVTLTKTLTTELSPGTNYYARVRASNPDGTGPYSGVRQFRTLSGAYVSDGTVWNPGEVLISDGSVWGAGEVLVSDGSVWNPAG